MLSTRKLINEKIQETMNELLKANTFGRLESFIMNTDNEITYTRELLGYWKGCNIYCNRRCQYLYKYSRHEN